MSELTIMSKANQFSFQCPIFNTETKMASCMKLRDMVWKGQLPEQRKGCQIAMKCSKCPAAELVAMSYNKSYSPADAHVSPVPKKGKLQAIVLAKVQNVMIREDIVRQISASPAELTLLRSSSERVTEMMKTAPGEAPVGATTHSKPRKTKAKEAPAIKSAPAKKINEAARTGDLSAAINT